MRPMPTVKLDFDISETGLAIIDAMRGDRERDEFLRHVIELGLCEVMESAARTARDYTTSAVMGETRDYRDARKQIFGIDEPTEPPAVTEPESPPLPPTTPPTPPNGADPNHIPRGVRR
jgi:hypothetical protein